MLKQRTLKAAIKTTGVGLHTGARVEINLRPAAPDSGIVFHRVDLPAVVSIPASAANVGDTRLSSTLKRDGASISTVEHLMSALAGLGIDNLHVDVAGPELPILDGARVRSSICCSPRASSSRARRSAICESRRRSN